MPGGSTFVHEFSEVRTAAKNNCKRVLNVYQITMAI